MCTAIRMMSAVLILGQVHRSQSDIQSTPPFDLVERFAASQTRYSNQHHSTSNKHSESHVPCCIWSVTPTQADTHGFALLIFPVNLLELHPFGLRFEFFPFDDPRFLLFAGPTHGSNERWSEVPRG